MARPLHMQDRAERDGMKRLFQPNGRLFCWLDRYGNQLAFEHDHCGDLDFVLDAYGRQIDFTFTDFADGKRRLTRITDFMGREVVYSYDQDANLIAVRSPIVTGTSTGNDFPAGRTERYAYYGGSDEKLKHNLVSVTAPEEVANGGEPWPDLQTLRCPGSPQAGLASREPRRSELRHDGNRVSVMRIRCA